METFSLSKGARIPAMQDEERKKSSLRAGFILQLPLREPLLLIYERA
jgi:hypothetical protein